MGTKCIVYDVVFHPDTYYLLQKNERFKKMIHDTALDAIERQFHVKLDKVNVRTPKMTFKGMIHCNRIKCGMKDKHLMNYFLITRTTCQKLHLFYLHIFFLVWRSIPFSDGIRCWLWWYKASIEYCHSKSSNQPPLEVSQCMGHAEISWSAVCLMVSHSRFDKGVRSYVHTDE